MTKTPYPQIDFAKRHLVQQGSTFNAAASLQRLSLLIDDINDLAPILNPILEERWAPAFFEFSSYYNVGFVTCLEWHARSRLYDLITFDPGEINSKDLERNISAAQVSQMVSEGLSIPHLIVGSVNVSSSDAYISTIERVLKRLGKSGELSKLLSLGGEGGSSIGDTLKRLFKERNDLVHEIRITDIGHRNIRNVPSLNDALDVGKNVYNLVRGIEKIVTDNAPNGFPNVLNADGYEIYGNGALLNDIESIENDILKSMADREAALDDLSYDEFSKLVDKSRNYIEAEMAFINKLMLPGWQYMDIRPHLEKNLLLNRIKYLLALKQEVAFDDETMDVEI